MKPSTATVSSVACHEDEEVNEVISLNHGQYDAVTRVDPSGNRRRLVNLKQGAALAIQRKSSEHIVVLGCVSYNNELACIREVITDAVDYRKRLRRLADRNFAAAGGTGAGTR